MCKVLIQLTQNFWKSLRHKLTSILYTDRYTDGHTDGYGWTDRQADSHIPPPTPKKKNICFVEMLKFFRIRRKKDNDGC